MDIVERLREGKFVGGKLLMIEAAGEIERLRKDYALAWENHLLHEQIFVLTEAKIERLQEQAHYHYENGLKKDVEIERLREALQNIVKTADWPTQLTIAKSTLQQKETE